MKNRRHSRRKTTPASPTRRQVLARVIRAGAIGAALSTGVLGLMPMRSARSSSGELRLLHWSDQLPYPVIPDFERETGIKVMATPFSDSAAHIALLRDNPGKYDLCQPMQHLAPRFREAKLLAPLDTKKMSNVGNIVPSMLESAKIAWTWDGDLYHLPHCWGCEGISWRTDLATIERAALSYSTLWREDLKGKVQAHPDSLLMGIGLWLDYTGRMPSNRMADAFKNPDAMRTVYDAIVKVAVEKKDWIARYWIGPYEIKSNLQSGAVIGLTWDGPVMTSKREGKPVDFMAPLEGAMAWFSGWSMAAGARNKEQAYAWLDYLATARVAAKVAEGSGYSPVVNGATGLLSEATRLNFDDAFPGDSLDQLWYRPAEPVWFAEQREEYLRKIRTA
jgi:spermidine/putrescine transport system substrate-binding protein